MNGPGNIPVARRTRAVRAWIEWARTSGAFALALAGVLALAFPDVWFLGRTFVLRDFGYYACPIAYHLKARLLSGEMPLWNALSSTGLPFLAQWNTMALYPGSLIYLALPLPWSLSAFCLAHQFLGGLGMWRLAHRWTREPWGAAVAGLAFALSGFMLNCLMWPSFVATLAWMPWVVAAAERAWREGGRAILVAALAGAMQALAGTPEVILFTWVVAGALWLENLAGHRGAAEGCPPSAGASLRRLAAVGLLIAGLTAAQVLPFLQLLRYSERSAGYADALWSMPGWGWANLLVPLFGCYRAPQGVFFQQGQDWTSSYYLGIGVLALAAGGAVAARPRRVVWLAALAIGGLLLALGDASPVYPWLRRLVPQSGYMRFPVKFVVLAVFAVPLLAAYGVRTVAGGPGGAACAGPSRVALGAIGLGLGAAVVALAGFGVSAGFFAPEVDGWQHALGRLGCLGGIVGAALLLGALRRRPVARWLGGALLAAVALDPLTHAPWQNPAVPASLFAPGLLAGGSKMDPMPRLGEARAWVTRQAHDQTYRRMLSDPGQDFLCHRLWLFGNLNLLENVPLVEGFFPVHLRAQREVWAAAFFALPGREAGPLLDFLGVVQAPSPARVLEWTARPSALPPITGGQQPVFLPAERTLAAVASPGFRPHEQVILPLEARAQVANTNAATVRVTQGAPRAQRLQARIDASAPALIVLAQSWYPAWKARVNGRPAPVLRANHAFQAVPVPAGESQLEVVYEDSAFRLGAALSLATLLAVALLWGRSRGPRAARPLTDA